MSTHLSRLPFRRPVLVIAITALIAGLYGPGVPLASGQFGAIRDAARRAAEEKRKADEAKREAEETKRREEAKQPPAGAPAEAAPAAQPAASAGSAAQPTTASTSADGAATFQSYSKFDFVPGEKIVAADDFTQDAVGDFPAKWNTNASGEIVTIAGQPGRWLKLTKAGFFTPEFVTDLPDNVTVEFDLTAPPGFNAGFPLQTAFVQLDATGIADWQTATNSFIFTAHPSPSQGATQMTTRQDGTSAVGNSSTTTQLAANGRPVHIAVWRQRQRVRVYMNQEKVWDMPRAAAASAKFNSLIFFVPGGCGDCEYYLGNLRVATGAPDTRNKILSEGKWVTHGILFDVNSDRIKPESYGTLKEVAGVLAESADVKVLIVGHTDADGDDTANIDLSRRRAASVKSALVSEFKIDAGRLDTDGKGETQPIDKNDNPAGKANNRRVEFIKK